MSVRTTTLQAEPGAAIMENGSTEAARFGFRHRPWVSDAVGSRPLGPYRPASRAGIDVLRAAVAFVAMRPKLGGIGTHDP